MRRFNGMMMALVLSMAALMAKASDVPLEVRIGPSAVPENGQSGHVIVTVTNHGDLPLLLPRPFTPLEHMDGHLLNNIFVVKDASGKTARFIGRTIRMLPEERQMFYTRIDAGQTLTHEVALIADYALPSGYYDVSYRQTYVGLSGYRSDDELLVTSESNTLRIYVNQSLIEGMKQPGPSPIAEPR